MSLGVRLSFCFLSIVCVSILDNIHFILILVTCNIFSNKIIIRNCRLAFRVAEEALGIPPLLEVEDLTSGPRPDSLSVTTYLAQFYHALADPDSDSGSASKSSIRRFVITEKAPTKVCFAAREWIVFRVHPVAARGRSR